MKRLLSLFVIGALALLTGCTITQEMRPSRVMQSVQVQLASDASVQNIRDSVLLVDDSKSNSELKSHRYGVARTANDLPMRVSVRWKTAKGQGTDLSKLAGYSGKIQVAVTVENLTATPEKLSYDVAGQKKTATALVATPLSVAASTTLPTLTTSNGIVTATDSGDNVVQWAQVLAPPLTDATSVFEFETTAKNFQVPSITISAQPGIGEEPSTLGLLRETSGDRQLKIQKDTVRVVAEVNDILKRAGATITELRTTLTDTSKQFGTRTAHRLADSSKSLNESMRSVSGQITGLEQSLRGSITGSNSSLLAHLSGTVATLRELLGDTSQEPLSVEDVTDCEIMPAELEGGSVYQTFLALGHHLKRYAAGTEHCRAQLEAAMTEFLGPEVPDDEACVVEKPTPVSQSVACVMWRSSRDITAGLIDLQQAGEALARSINADSVHSAQKQYARVEAEMTRTRELLVKVREHDHRVPDSELDELAAQLRSTRETIDAARGEITSTADGALAELNGAQSPSSLAAQTAFVADRLCELDAPAQQVRQLRRYLTDTPCPGAGNRPAGSPEANSGQGGPSNPGNPGGPGGPGAPGTPGNPGGNGPGDGNPGIGPGDPRFRTPLNRRLADQAERWNRVRDSANTSGLAAVSQQLSNLEQRVNALRERANSGHDAQQRDFDALATQLAAASEQLQPLDRTLAQLEREREALSERVSDTFTSATEKMQRLNDTATLSHVTTVRDQVNRGTAMLTAQLVRSSTHMSTTAQALETGGKTLIDEQQAKLAETENHTLGAVDNYTRHALEEISQTTGSAVRDTDAAREQLAQSLANVLLDLGDGSPTGGGLIGQLHTDAAKAQTADYQLSLASQRASGFANLRAQDIDGVLLRSAHVRAVIAKAERFPMFHFDAPEEAQSHTVYSFVLGAHKK